MGTETIHCLVSAKLKLFLRRRAASALLIQNLEFQTISCVSVRSMYVMKKRAKHRMVSAPARHGIYNGDFFSRFSRCRRKVRLRGEGMICRDPKKVNFFQLFDHSNYAHMPSQNDKKLTPAVLERSCPRTYLPSRAGATHALRVLSSYTSITTRLRPVGGKYRY